MITFLRWFTLTGLLFWFVVYWQAGRKAIVDIQKSASTANARLDTMLMVIIGAFSLLVAGTGLLMSLNLIQNTLLENWGVTLAGCMLSTAGIIGMFFCRNFLGRFWTAETALIQNHQVVDRGPYQIVRHPIYTFAIMLYLGLGLVYLTWWNLLSVVIIIIAYAIKAWDEDRFLAQNLPDYKVYQQRVQYRLIPGIY